MCATASASMASTRGKSVAPVRGRWCGVVAFVRGCALVSSLARRSDYAVVVWYSPAEVLLE